MPPVPQPIASRASGCEVAFMPAQEPTCKIDFYVDDEWPALLPFMRRMQPVLATQHRQAASST